MALKFYLAAAFSRQTEMRQCAAAIREVGHQVECRWIFYHDEAEVDWHTLESCAKEDLEDVRQCDYVISFTEPSAAEVVDALQGDDLRAAGVLHELQKRRGGRHAEFAFGYAQAEASSPFAMRAIVIGPREQIFHYLPGVAQFRDFSQFLEWLTGVEEVSR